MRISDWSSDVCSSDLDRFAVVVEPVASFVGGPDPDLVQPAREIGRGADVGADGDDALGDFGGVAGEVEQGAAKGGRCGRDRQSVVEGKSVSVRVELGGSRSHKKHKKKQT